MKLKGKIIGDLNGVEQSFRSLYVEAKDKDGKPILQDGKQVYLLDVEDMEHRDDVQGLKSALENERQQGTQRQNKIVEHEATIARLNTDLEAARKKPIGKSDEDVQTQIKAATEELTNRHKAELDATKAVGDIYRSHLDTVMRKQEAIKAITSPGQGAKRTKGEPDLLLLHVLERTQFVEDKDANGNIADFRVVVVNEKGTPRIGDSQGNPMTLDGLLDEMFANPTYARAFEPAGGGGSGAQHNTTAKGGQNTITRAAFGQLSPSDQMAHVKAGGQVSD